jgi:hypothetical protein
MSENYDDKTKCPLDGFKLQKFCSTHDHVLEDVEYECPHKNECKQMREDYERTKE